MAALAADPAVAERAAAPIGTPSVPTGWLELELARRPQTPGSGA